MEDIEAAFVARELELKTSAVGKPWTSVNVAVGDGGEVQWLRLAVLGDLAQQLALVRNEVDGLQLIVAHPNIKALEEIMQLIIDTAPISKTSCQSE